MKNCGPPETLVDGSAEASPEIAHAKGRFSLKGRRVGTKALREVQALVGSDRHRRDMLVENLHLLQDRFGYLSSAHIAALAQILRLAQAEIHEVATFYHHFDVVKDGEMPPPALTVRVCDSLSCALAGSQELFAGLGPFIGNDLRVLPTPCVGRCEVAPCIVVGQNPVGHATVAAVMEVISRRQLTCPATRYIDFSAYCGQGGYQLITDCLEGRRTREQVTKVVEDAGLRGLGGAGFPAARKWKIVAAEAGLRLMAVNIDEGEPGTFKDRHFLETDPHRFLEGMLIAAWCAGVAEIYIYLRDEYAGCRAILEKEIGQLEKCPPCALPPIHLRRGAGAYVCGEESAMIESLEGKRGFPRLRPPYVAQVGLFGRPTLAHNLETLYRVREIVEKGGAWFASQGRNGRHGLLSFSVSGRVKRPGVHTAPAGITVRELIDEFCGGMLDGHSFYGYLPGGASGGILPASRDDVPLDFDTLEPLGCFIGSAAVIILSETDRASDAARNLLAFFNAESCGKCTPCRVGTGKALVLVQARQWNQPLLEELSHAMQDASICGLGQAAPNPVLSVLKYFPQEVQ